MSGEKITLPPELTEDDFRGDLTRDDVEKRLNALRGHINELNQVIRDAD